MPENSGESEYILQVGVDTKGKQYVLTLSAKCLPWRKHYLDWTAQATTQNSLSDIRPHGPHYINGFNCLITTHNLAVTSDWIWHLEQQTDILDTNGIGDSVMETMRGTTATRKCGIGRM